ACPPARTRVAVLPRQRPAVRTGTGSASAGPGRRPGTGKPRAVRLADPSPGVGGEPAWCGGGLLLRPTLSGRGGLGSHPVRAVGRGRAGHPVEQRRGADHDGGGVMTEAGTPGLLDRVVAVTGAGRGLGLQIVRELLAQGAQVVANYRSWSEDLEQVRKEAAGRVHLVRGDIGEEAGAVALAQRARELGGLDALVCNAAVTRDRLLVHMPVEDWD